MEDFSRGYARSDYTNSIELCHAQDFLTHCQFILSGAEDNRAP